MIAPQTYLRACSGIAFLGGCLMNAEILSLFSSFGSDNFLAHTRTFADTRHRRSPRSRRISRVVDPLVFWLAIMARFLSCGVGLLCLWLHLEIRGALLTYVIASAVLLNWKPLGHNASDEMHLLVMLALCGGAFGDAYVQSLSLIFIGCQVSLAYLTAGAVKANEKTWKNGTNLKQILSTQSFGHRGLALLLARYTWLPPLASGFIVFGEILAGFAILMPWRVTVAVLFGATIFHLFTSFAMGLNTFVWAFACAFPATIYTSRVLYASLATLARSF